MNQDDAIFEALWRFQHLTVHRYGGSLSGEVLMVLTITVLDRAGRHASISELAAITGLPKSSISRYVSNQLKIGHLQESVDPKDRRRRVLSPTDEGKKELDWLTRQIADMSKSMRDDDTDPSDRLMKIARQV